MSLNIVAGWVGFACALLAVISMGTFLVAAGSGYGGWAALAGGVFLLTVATAVTVVGGTVRHDRKLGLDVPHFP
ncbi:hypothetical protein ACFWPA_06690 [Rhodococcus sp. NPDC058505]|uniref:hypothetical protein n=1 Tax=unclassified Rhodococcus (in: high G+C Gram-positive bacteria) TaxID=192944 RepID=UPI003657D50A